MKGNAVALAGIAATAILGIAGTTTGWLVARDDQANQRALAHDNLVYNRRADAYLAALTMMQRQRRSFDEARTRAGDVDLYTELANDLRKNPHPKVADRREFEQLRSQLLREGDLERRHGKVGVNGLVLGPRFPMAYNRDAYVWARLVAFGSQQVVAAYLKSRVTAENAEFHWRGSGNYGVKVVERVLNDDFLQKFYLQQRHFEQLVHRELS